MPLNFSTHEASERHDTALRANSVRLRCSLQPITFDRHRNLIAPLLLFGNFVYCNALAELLQYRPMWEVDSKRLLELIESKQMRTHTGAHPSFKDIAKSCGFQSSVFSKLRKGHSVSGDSLSKLFWWLRTKRVSWDKISAYAFRHSLPKGLQ